MRIFDCHSHWATEGRSVMRTDEDWHHAQRIWKMERRIYGDEEQADYFRKHKARAILDLSYTKTLPIEEMRQLTEVPAMQCGASRNRDIRCEPLKARNAKQIDDLFAGVPKRIQTAQVWLYDEHAADPSKKLRSISVKVGVTDGQFTELVSSEPLEAGTMIVTEFDKKPFMDAMGDIYRDALADPKLSQLVDRIRQVK